MVTSKLCLDIYGYPDADMERRHLTIWNVPKHITQAIPELPNRIYCNKDLVTPLQQAFENIIERDRACEVVTWDGCFNIRKKRGRNTWSIHAWALAIDINAAWNGLGQEPQLSHELVSCFTDAGFTWGGTWKRKDGMHFQIAQL